MVKVAAIDLLLSDPLIQTCFEYCLAKVVDATGTCLDSVWSKLGLFEKWSTLDPKNLYTIPFHSLFVYNSIDIVDNHIN